MKNELNKFQQDRKSLLLQIKELKENNFKDRKRKNFKRKRRYRYCPFRNE